MSGGVFLTQCFELALLLMPHIQVSKQDSAGRSSLPHAGRPEPGAGTISISGRIQPHCFSHCCTTEAAGTTLMAMATGPNTKQTTQPWEHLPRTAWKSLFELPDPNHEPPPL